MAGVYDESRTSMPVRTSGGLSMTFSKIPRVAVGVTAAGIAAVAIGVGAFAAEGRFQPTVASTAAPTTARKADEYCNRFLSHLAGNLGKSQSEVATAVGKAVTQTIDDAVASGDLTKTQADRVKAKLATGPACNAGFGGSFGYRAKGRAELPAVLDAAAKSLNLTTAELKADLAKGQTLHQIADSKSITQAQFRAALIKNLTPVLDQAVSQGKLTKTQETEVLQHLQTGAIPFWDSTLKHHRTPSPAASPAAGA
jgi:polyhydroxyalkanoate synthesis regulator phasin